MATTSSTGKATARQSAPRKSRPRKSALVETAPSRAPQRATPLMSAAHKQALAVGREESRAVRRYLEALEAHKPKRGRKRTAEGIQGRLRQIESRLPAADALTRVH